MSFRATTLKRSQLVGFFLVLTGLTAWSQVANTPLKFADVGAITSTLVQASSLGESSGGSSDDSKWLKVEFHFSITKDAGPYVDEADFKIWIEGRDLLDPQGKPNEGVAVALTGSVAYINIAQGKDVYGVFYVHPSTLKRYCKQGSTDFERTFNVHMEASVGGKVVDVYDKKKEQDPNWYQPLKPVPGLVYRQNQCVFVVTDPSRYPAIKLPADSNN